MVIGRHIQDDHIAKIAQEILTIMEYSCQFHSTWDLLLLITQEDTIEQEWTTFARQDSIVVEEWRPKSKYSFTTEPEHCT